MLLWLDRIVERARANDREVRGAELVPARGAAVLADGPGDLDRRLDRELRESVPDLGRRVRLHENDLSDASAVAEHSERDLTRRADVRDPAADADGSADVVAK